MSKSYQADIDRICGRTVTAARCNKRDRDELDRLRRQVVIDAATIAKLREEVAWLERRVDELDGSDA